MRDKSGRNFSWILLKESHMNFCINSFTKFWNSVHVHSGFVVPKLLIRALEKSGENRYLLSPRLAIATHNFSLLDERTGIPVV